MTKKEMSALIVGTIFLFVIIVSLLFTAINIIPFVLSKPLAYYSGLFVAVSTICFGYFAFSFVGGREERLGKAGVISIKIISVVLSLIIVFASVALTMFLMVDKLVKREISPDKKYEVFITESDMFDDWTATVYKRHSIFFKSELNSETVHDYIDGNANISWEDDCCKVTFDYYTDENGEEKPISTKIYFD